MRRTAATAAFLATLLAAAAAPGQDAPVPALALPVACEVGRTCQIQNQVDLDPGPEARDFTCGTMTYDGHDGVDFRIPDLATMRAGVDVLAAAPGLVRGMRDGMPDRSVRETGRAAVAKRECGNGVSIAHGDGWETQYCHLAEGSVRVTRGQRVEAGQVIGRIGMSGMSEYPHLHFSVRRAGKSVDPFAFERDPAVCGSGRSIWAAGIRDSLAYRTPVVLKAGFADGAVAEADVDSGAIDGRRVGPGSPALVTWVRGIVLKEGDRQRLTLLGPDGEQLATSSVPALERPRAQQMMFVGKRRPADGWAPGTYVGRYEVERGGAVALRSEVRLDMPAS